MAKVQIVTEDAELIEEIDVGDWNLDKPLARASFWDQLFQAIKLAQYREDQDAQSKQS